MSADALKALIETHRKKAEGAPAADTRAAIIQDDELWSLLEKLAEDLGKNRQLATHVTDWMQEQTNEIKSLREVRFWMVVIAVVMSIITLMVFYFMLLWPSSPLHLAEMGDPAKVALISATFVSSFGLIAIILRGAFVASKTDDVASNVPEAIKLVTGMLKEMGITK